MRLANLKLITIAGLCLALVTGCQTNSEKQLLATDKSQVQLRSIQTRSFDTDNKKMVVRSVISTLQDLEFVMDNADLVLGTVSGTKYGQVDGLLPYQLKMTVTIRPRNKEQMLVRASAQYNIQAVSDPEPYQNFFTALEKSLFLTAHNVD